MAPPPPPITNWSTLTLLHLLPTGYMTGLIWFVQVVHYPLFAAVGERTFYSYEQRHCALTTWVVLPPMVAELALSIWLLVRAPDSVTGLTITGLLLVVAIWLATFAYQVPCHDRLQTGFDAVVHRRLVRSNWLRTGLWTARLAIAFWLCLAAA